MRSWPTVYIPDLPDRFELPQLSLFDSSGSSHKVVPQQDTYRIYVCGITPYDAHVLTLEKETAAYYESVAKGRDAKQAANWVMGDLFAAINRTKTSIAEPPVSAADLGALLDLMADGTLSGKLAKEVFEAMVETGRAPGAIVEERGLKQVTDTGAIEAVIDQVLAANADKVAEYRSGKDKLFGFFVGQTMKAMQGKGNPALVNDVLKQKLS